MINLFGRSVRAPSNFARFVLLGGLSVLLMILDHRGNHLAQIRAALDVLATPIQYVAVLPVRAGGAVADFFTSSRTLHQTIEELRVEQQRSRMQLQQLEAIAAENARLRAMLGSAARVADRALAADLLEVSPEPFTRTVLLARGSRDGVYVGQPAIDAYGIIGQVTRVSPQTSQVTLITDPGHAIPVLVNRSGLRAIVFGTGAQDSLRVPYLTASADIREGDLLVSSGMGGVFPPDFPVARIERIHADPNEAFLEIAARPVAHLNHNKQALLVWPGSGRGSAKDAGAGDNSSAGPAAKAPVTPRPAGTR